MSAQTVQLCSWCGDWEGQATPDPACPANGGGAHDLIDWTEPVTRIWPSQFNYGLLPPKWRPNFWEPPPTVAETLRDAASDDPLFGIRADEPHPDRRSRPSPGTEITVGDVTYREGPLPPRFLELWPFLVAFAGASFMLNVALLLILWLE